jgi:hypothetical protein
MSHVRPIFFSIANQTFWLWSSVGSSNIKKVVAAAPRNPTSIAEDPSSNSQAENDL